MQEKLKIFSLEGSELLERDLSAETKPLVILAGEKPVIVDAVPPGADVLGALVRDEDGWTLASARSDVPVSSGPKKGADFHLTAGISCTLGPWLFRIEREGTATGTVLLWKVGSSGIVADPLIAGRNTVAKTRDGSYAVNPAVPAEELCDIFLADDGIEVIPLGGDRHRIAVPMATLFSSGSFRAMAMTASDAAAAVKSGNPFAWPGRKTRAGFMAALLLCGLVCLAALSLVKEKSAVDAAAAARSGAEEFTRALTAASAAADSNEDVLVYKSAFYKSLPLITGRERSPVTRDLISRGQQLAGHLGADPSSENAKNINRIVAFLKSVDAIQSSIGDGDWQALKTIVSGCDKEMFVRCDAGKFLGDARELADFVTVELPKFISSVSETGSKKADRLKSASGSAFGALKNNMFMSGEIMVRERAAYDERMQILLAYIARRDAFLGSDEAPDRELLNIWADFVSAFDPADESFAAMIGRERALLSDAVVKRASKVKPVALARLCEFASALGVDAAKLSQWSDKAAAARKEILARCRELYTEYRMRSTESQRAAGTLSVLDDIISLGLEDSTYYKWAVRERERLNETKGEGK